MLEFQKIKKKRKKNSRIQPILNNFRKKNIYKNLVTNSNVKHELEGSEYSQRRDQCYKAANICKKESLREVTSELLDGA